MEELLDSRLISVKTKLVEACENYHKLVINATKDHDLESPFEERGPFLDLVSKSIADVEDLKKDMLAEKEKGELRKKRRIEEATRPLPQSRSPAASSPTTLAHSHTPRNPPQNSTLPSHTINSFLSASASSSAAPAAATPAAPNHRQDAHVLPLSNLPASLRAQVPDTLSSTVTAEKAQLCYIPVQNHKPTIEFLKQIVSWDRSVPNWRLTLDSCGKCKGGKVGAGGCASAGLIPCSKCKEYCVWPIGRDYFVVFTKGGTKTGLPVV